jgi:uncharacterized membrane protein
VLSLVPVLAGASRFTELTTGAPVTPDNARFFASPVPVLVHIVSVTIYSLLGAFQFAAGFRRRWPVWHRRAGRVLVAAGLGTALSGLWMTLFYPRPPEDDLLITGFRLVFGSAMLVWVVLGFLAIRRRDIGRHRAFMTRAYAIGMGAGTQVFTHLPWLLLVGKPGGFPRAMLMLAGWVINVVMAEWLIRRRVRPVVRPRVLQTRSVCGGCAERAGRTGRRIQVGRRGGTRCESGMVPPL